MITLPTTSESNVTTHTDCISRGEFSYICSRNQHQAHDLLLRAIRNSGLTQKQLSERTGIDEATISRLLSRPRNMELNTFSKLHYAASGAALNFLPSYPAQGSEFILRVSDGNKEADTASAMFLFGYPLEAIRASRVTGTPIVIYDMTERSEEYSSKDDNNCFKKLWSC